MSSIIKDWLKCCEGNKQGAVTEILQIGCSGEASLRRGMSQDLLIVQGSEFSLLEQRSGNCKCSGQNTQSKSSTGITKKLSSEAPTSSIYLVNNRWASQSGQNHYPILADMYSFLQIRILLKRLLTYNNNYICRSKWRKRLRRHSSFKFERYRQDNWFKQLFSFIKTSSLWLRLQLPIYAHLATPPALPATPKKENFALG